MDEGSDSNPSEDNMDAKEIINILPAEVQIELAKKVSEEKKGSPAKKVITQPGAKPAVAKIGKEPVKTLSAARPGIEETKKDFRTRASHRVPLHQRKERHNIVQYIEMIDSWTQTSFHEDAYFFKMYKVIDQKNRAKAKIRCFTQKMHSGM